LTGISWDHSEERFKNLCHHEMERRSAPVKRSEINFYEPMGRFPTVGEDEPACRLLCTEYPAAE